MWVLVYCRGGAAAAIVGFMTIILMAIAVRFYCFLDLFWRSMPGKYACVWVSAHVCACVDVRLCLSQ